MRNPLELLTIHRNFVFVGGVDYFNEVLKTEKDLNWDALSEKEIEFKPTISLGTVSFGGVGIGISVRALITAINSEGLQISLKTAVRPEHFLLILVFAFSLITMISTNECSGRILFVFGLWIACHVWFQFVYRVQENFLIEKIIKRFRLQKLDKDIESSIDFL